MWRARAGWTPRCSCWVHLAGRVVPRAIVDLNLLDARALLACRRRDDHIVATVPSGELFAAHSPLGKRFQVLQGISRLPTFSFYLLRRFCRLSCAVIRGGHSPPELEQLRGHSLVSEPLPPPLLLANH